MIRPYELLNYSHNMPPAKMVPAGRNPVRHEVAKRAVVLYKDMIPPSIRLDEPTILNKERIEQSSKA